VFDGQKPTLNGLMSAFLKDLHQWELAGARGVTHLLVLSPIDSLVCSLVMGCVYLSPR
jgi:hypothetical protein